MAGFWNVNSWNVNGNCDNYGMRYDIIKYCDMDVIGIAETYLRGDQQLQIPGYTWLGKNRIKLKDKNKLSLLNLIFFSRGPFYRHIC